jgi:hypothetical protein
VSTAASQVAARSALATASVMEGIQAKSLLGMSAQYQQGTIFERLYSSTNLPKTFAASVYSLSGGQGTLGCAAHILVGTV